MHVGFLLYYVLTIQCFSLTNIIMSLCVLSQALEQAQQREEESDHWLTYRHSLTQVNFIHSSMKLSRNRFYWKSIRCGIIVCVKLHFCELKWIGMKN